MSNNIVVGYKVFNPDWTCRGFQYEVGKHFVHDGDVEECRSGFHFCESLADCFSYYPFDPKNKVAIVEASGQITERGSDCSKRACSELFVREEIAWEEVLRLCNTGSRNTGRGNTGNWNTGDRNTGNWNTGDRNTGDRNTGDRNTGNRNTGDWNTGDWNTGDWNTGDWNTGDRNTGNRNTGDRNTGNRNTGDWNTGDRNTGYFNTTTPDVIDVFNKSCSREEFDKWDKPNFLYFVTVDDYGNALDYKEQFQKAWKEASEEEKEQMKKCPNFDPDVFYEISGIRV